MEGLGSLVKMGTKTVHQMYHKCPCYSNNVTQSVIKSIITKIMMFVSIKIKSEIKIPLPQIKTKLENR